MWSVPVKMSKVGKLAPLIAKFLAESASKKGFDRWMQSKLRVISNCGGSVVCELTVDQDLVNVNDHLHGGCTATLLDVVSGMALMTTRPPGVTVELNVAYMSTAKVGDEIVINASTLKAGRSFAFMTVDIKRKTDGALIAVGRQTLYNDKDKNPNTWSSTIWSRDPKT